MKYELIILQACINFLVQIKEKGYTTIDEAINLLLEVRDEENSRRKNKEKASSI